MGDKSPKDKNKKQAQKVAVNHQKKGDHDKRQASLDNTPKKSK
jgi:hypothetical protein